MPVLPTNVRAEFEESFTDALILALVDINVKCRFTIDIDGECFLAEKNQALQDELQEAIDGMEWDDVQVSHKFSLQLDWTIFKSFDELCVKINPDPKFHKVKVSLDCTDEVQLYTDMLAAGYQAPTPRKRKREEEQLVVDLTSE